MKYQECPLREECEATYEGLATVPRLEYIEDCVHFDVWKVHKGGMAGCYFVDDDIGHFYNNLTELQRQWDFKETKK